MSEIPKTTEIHCPECDSRIEVEDEHIGAKGKCPDCDHKFIVEKPAKAKEEKKKPKEEAKTTLNEIANGIGISSTTRNVTCTSKLS